MTRRQGRGLTPRSGEPAGTDDWLISVGAAAAAASKAPVDLLEEYLPMLADAAIDGRGPEAWELEAGRELGRRAASVGVVACRAVDLYLSAACRLGRQLPVLAGASVPEMVRS